MLPSLCDMDVHALISLNNELQGAVLSAASIHSVLNDFLSSPASPLLACLSVHRVASRSRVNGSGSCGTALLTSPIQNVHSDDTQLM